jgi:transitional endoplasmic reticulum ATPase
MSFRKKLLPRRVTRHENLITDKDDLFITRKCIEYLSRYLETNPFNRQDFLKIVSWVMGDEMIQMGSAIIKCIPEDKKEYYANDLEDDIFDTADYGFHLEKIITQYGLYRSKELRSEFLKLLDQRYQSLIYKGKSNIEKNAAAIQSMFNLSLYEIEFLIFYFIMESINQASDFFDRFLDCKEFAGVKYLCQVLRINRPEYNRLISGKLQQVGILDANNRNVSIHHDLILLIQNPFSQTSAKNFFDKALPSTIPVEAHMFSSEKLAHTINLLKGKPKKSSHILLYGPPGTGKTSFARALPSNTDLPAYEIKRENTNKTEKRRAAIEACLNMTNSGSGSLIIVDEADNLLNTRFSWFYRGETQDKGWLNELMERPGVRMIWITNSIENIEPSVLRRFTFSLNFKALSTNQRIQIWDRILRKHKIKKFVNQSDIVSYAQKFNVSAGVIEQAIARAGEHHKTKATILKSIDISMDAYLEMLHDRCTPKNHHKIEDHYSIEGLNVTEGLHVLIERLTQFDQYLKTHPYEQKTNMNLLFYGPPGTGKSELAAYLARHLDRHLYCKQSSELLSCYIGETEKNIRRAFEEAETDGAVLVIDEVDSFLFSRDRAVRSWEITLTNELLAQMERFRGILICTTNHLEGLDTASIRRFNHKIAFKHLDADGKIIFYHRLFKCLTKTPLNHSQEMRIRQISDLSPGDFKTIRDRFRLYKQKEITHYKLIEALEQESQIKHLNLSIKRVGF